MKKKSPTAIFIGGFLKSFLLIAILIIVGFGSYKLTMFYYSETDASAETKIDDLIKEVVTDVQVDEISKNLIYSYNKENKSIENMVLEIFNKHTKNMDYITIPINTQFMVSDNMYKRLCVSNPEIPQIIVISDISTYFNEESMYEYGVILIEELLGLDISYFTVVDAENFDTVFTKENNILKPSDSYIEEINELDTEDKIKEYIKNWYEKIESNLTYKNKLKYVDAYLETKTEYIYCHSLSGGQEGTKFTVDIEENEIMLDNIVNNGAYKISQADYEETNKGEVISSKSLNIQVDNSSNISGLASSYKEKLTTAGYKVLGAGNYSKEALNSSRIIVREKGYGKDLLSYFKNAVIEVGETPENIDIWIILGKEDGQDN